jgi:hypothetical protein
MQMGPLVLSDLGGGLYEGQIVTDSAGEYQVALRCDCTPAAGPTLVRQSFANVWVDRHPDDVTAVPPVDSPSQSFGNVEVRILSTVPNPFNPNVTIAFESRAPGRTRVNIYTLNGRKVATVLQGFRDAGIQQVVWQGRDDSGHAVASGVYLVTVTVEGVSASQKVVLLK